MGDEAELRLDLLVALLVRRALPLEAPERVTAGGDQGEAVVARGTRERVSRPA